jgi:uncharacterized protein (TIGR03435 family)
MPDANDMELMQEYAGRNSEAAFAELVHRHINLVYSVALRFTGDPGDAQDVTQAVFIILAQKAAGLRHRTSLTGWLYETTRLTARQSLRTRIRRQAREQEAYMQSTLNDPDPGGAWRQLAPLLEEAMSRLNEKERTLLALRFFENKTGAETAALLGIREWAAHKRAERAVEKLRAFFTRRGIVLPAAVLTAAVSANSVQAAPVMLAKTVTAVAIAKDAAATTSTLTLIKGALKIMAWTKIKTAVLVGAGVLVVAGSTVATIEKINSDDSWRSLFHLLGESAVNANLDKTPPQVTILPTIHPTWGSTAIPGSNGRMIGINESVTNLIRDTYQQMPPRMIFYEPAPAGKYDYIANLPQGSMEALRQKIKDQFGLVAHKQITNVDLWVIKVSDPEKLSSIMSQKERPHMENDYGKGKLTMEDKTISDLAHALEGLLLNAPVLDQTELSEQYDFTLQWDVHNKSKRTATIIEQLHQVGLELVPTNMPIEMLVVEKVK